MKKLKIGIPLLALGMTSVSFTEESPVLPRKMRVSAGYNAASRLNPGCSWASSISGSFLYWQPEQDNMELAIVGNVASYPAIVNGQIVQAEATYKPGFKVEAKVQSNYDNWDTAVEYTWFRSTQQTHTSVEGNPGSTLFQLWLSPNGNQFHTASEKWQLQMDLLDSQLGRSCFMGKKLKLRPFVALRAAWINQSAHIEYWNASNFYHPVYTGSSDSWGIGPKVGVSSNWMMGSGFRLYGNLDGDMLYTRYTKLKTLEAEVTSSGSEIILKQVDENNLNTLRAHAQIELGLGWQYRFAKRASLDVAAGYGFQVFANQNMFRKFVDDLEPGSSFSPNGNLYMQGLTATIKLVF